MSYGTDVVLLPQTTVTANGNSYAAGPNQRIVDCSDYDAMLLVLEVTAASGTSPSLTVQVLTQSPATGNWVQIGSFPAQTAVGAVTLSLSIGQVPNKLAFAWTVAGTTPSFTFAVSALTKR